MKRLVFTCSPVGLIVGLIFDAFQALGLEVGDGGAEVGDGVRAVLQIEAVAGWVQPVNGGQPIKMVLPRLVSVEGVHATAGAPRHVVYCQKGPS